MFTSGWDPVIMSISRLIWLISESIRSSSRMVSDMKPSVTSIWTTFLPFVRWKRYGLPSANWFSRMVSMRQSRSIRNRIPPASRNGTSPLIRSDRMRGRRPAHPCQMLKLSS